jgi:hypothetical protein
MYDYSKLPNTEYGIEGYEVPVIHFDAAAKALDDKLFKIATNKMKKPKPRPIDMKAKRDGMDQVEARARNTPGPWTYDLELDWIHGNSAASKTVREAPPKELHSG